MTRAESRTLIAAAERVGAHFDLSHCVYGPMPHMPPGESATMPYYRVLAGLADVIQASRVLEIGTYYGGSTLAFLAGMHASPAGSVVTVDPTFHPNARLDSNPNVHRVTGNFPSDACDQAMSRAFPDGNIDIIYVDALKDGDFVRAVLDAAASMRPRIIVLDDIAANDSMEMLWRELCRQYPSAIAVTDVFEGVRNIEFDMGVIVLDESVVAPGLNQLRSPDAAFSDVVIGPPYEFVLHQQYPAIRTMMTKNETGMLHRLAKTRFRGRGQIVDAGSFLGASTACFAAALAERSMPLTSRIHAYDRFTNSDSYFDKFMRTPVARYDSFTDQVTANVSGFLERINLYPGNFNSFRWVGQPIEILFADIAKTRRLNAHIYEEFSPYWMPGTTVYIQQDFVHLEAPWIQYAIASIIDHFIIIGIETPSLYLGVAEPIPDEAINRIAVDDFSPAEKPRLVESLAGRFDSVETRRTLQLVAARLWAAAGQRNLAMDIVFDCEADEAFVAITRGRARIARMRTLLDLA